MPLKQPRGYAFRRLIARASALWHAWFLAERPSLELSLFRIAVAITVGCHMLPSLFQLEDNYLSTAFVELNGSFFPIWALRLVHASPDWFVVAMAWVFVASWWCFLIGLWSQPSCLVMTLGCYYFYARNALHIGTLSFDILLVTLSLMWVTGYHGDSFSVDSLLRGDVRAYERRRPFFIQRLLQLQLAWTYWYTALHKITAGGNWLRDNPYYYLMHYPPGGVVRHFPFREVIGRSPELCYAIGLSVIAAEFITPLLWFNRRTRPVGLALGILFHVLLLVTLHVPTIFFFLFPPQMLLFIEPEDALGWIDAQREKTAERGRGILLYDGRCGFCLDSVARLQVVDLFRYVELVDFHGVANLHALHPALTVEACRSRMQLIEPDGRFSEGFLAFRRVSLKLPLLMPLAPLLYLPGASWIGQRIYDAIARRRFLFHRSARCATNQCGLTRSGGSSSSKA